MAKININIPCIVKVKEPVNYDNTLYGVITGDNQEKILFIDSQEAIDAKVVSNDIEYAENNSKPISIKNITGIFYADDTNLTITEKEQLQNISELFKNINFQNPQFKMLIDKKLSK